MSSQNATSSQHISSSQNQTFLHEAISDAAAKNAYDSLTSNQKKEITALIVRFFLFSQSKGLPIKRKDIIEKAFPNHSKAFSLLIADADKKLQYVFGFKIVEFSRKSLKYYLLHNILDVDPEMYEQFVELDVPEKSKLSCLTVILALIFMNQRPLPEDELWDFLKTLSVSSGELVHPLLGNVKALIGDFIKQMYLEKIKVSNPESITFRYEWGARAHLEFTPKQIIEFVAKVHNDPPEKWFKVYKHLLVKSQNIPAIPNESLDSTQINS